MRLPARVVLPFGYVVTVKQVTDTEMRTVDAGDLSDGNWDVDARAISIRKSLPIRRKRYVLIHELQHALLDLMHQMLDDGGVKP